jgi:16S rRNA (guanine527-N7)-methyltransferase
MTLEQFIEALELKGIQLSTAQLEQFDLYYQLLVEWNEKMNLTAITEKSQVYLKHFYDSISLSFFIPMSDILTMADIGSGAGFPSIPLKIVYPHLKVTIVDSLNKRVQFLNHVAGELGLQETNQVHARAEDAGRDSAYRDSYDLVTARAVARLSVLSEFCLPFVRVGGTFAAMKGSDAKEEIVEAAYALRELKGQLIADHPFELPFEQSSRHVILVEKTGKTPAKYPRKAGLPLKQPLLAKQ